MLKVIENYLALRRATGFAMSTAEYLLKSFAAFAAERGQTHVAMQTAIDWAALGPSVAQRDARLRAVCRFVRHIRVEDIRHELPPADHFGAQKRRRTPHIYTTDEISRLIEAGLLRPMRGMCPCTQATLIALLSATGQVKLRRNAAGRHHWPIPEDTMSLVRELARLMPDRQIAKLLNRVGKPTSQGNGWTEARVRLFRNYSNIAVYRKGEWAERGDVTLEAAAEIIGVAKMTVLRMIRRGDINGRQPCKGAPWVIKADDLAAHGGAGGSKGSITPNSAQRRLEFQWHRRVRIMTLGCSATVRSRILSATWAWTSRTPSP